jgi:hypothetical protein
MHNRNDRYDRSPKERTGPDLKVIRPGLPAPKFSVGWFLLGVNWHEFGVDADAKRL